jgi:hypothetical protein
MSSYSYVISTDFPNQVVNVASLNDEVLAVELSSTLLGISVEDSADSCVLDFNSDLSGDDETTLDGVVAAHTGGPATRFEFLAPSMLLHEEREITSDADWTDVGGVTTTVSSFVCDCSCAWGRVIGQVKVSGSGVEMRVVRASDGAVLNSTSALPADTSGAWDNFQFWANQNQPEETDAFILQARRNGATSLFVRFFSMSLLEKVS